MPGVTSLVNVGPMYLTLLLLQPALTGFGIIEESRRVDRNLRAGRLAHCPHHASVCAADALSAGPYVRVAWPAAQRLRPGGLDEPMPSRSREELP
jgi:hypothetical protein